MGLGGKVTKGKQQSTFGNAKQGTWDKPKVPTSRTAKKTCGMKAASAKEQAAADTTIPVRARKAAASKSELPVQR